VLIGVIWVISGGPYKSKTAGALKAASRAGGPQNRSRVYLPAMSRPAVRFVTATLPTTAAELASAAATFTAAEAAASKGTLTASKTPLTASKTPLTTSKTPLTTAAEAALASPEPSIPTAEAAVAVESAKTAILAESVVVKPAEITIPTESVVVEPAEIAVAVPPVEAAVKVVESMEPRAAAEAYPESRMHVIEVVPRSGADEYSVDKPVRPPVAVGGAIERIIGVVTPCAYRRRIVQAVARTYLYADRNLGL
jgi:hypothetical protein